MPLLRQKDSTRHIKGVSHDYVEGRWLEEVGSTKFFRLNDLKVLKWLRFKVHQLKQTLPTLDKNFAALDEKDTLFDVVSIMKEYLKDEPWVNLLCNIEYYINGKKMRHLTSSLILFILNLQDLTNPQDIEMLPPSVGSGPASCNFVQENNGTDKKVTRTTRQNKKAKVENDSQNIKDMFSRATRRKG